jgi:fibronectin type 3 domain-containing protein
MIAAPSFLGARAIPSGIELLWHQVPDASVSEYAVYRRLPSEETPTRITTAKKNATAYIDATAKAGVLYFYSVAAVTSAGEGPRSSEKGAQR